MFTLSGFADEIAQSLEEQIETLKKLKIRYLELRGVWGKNVLSLDDAEVERVKAALTAAGIGVSAIGSPIGKVGINEDFAPHLERVKRALEIAKVLGTQYIRIFSYFIPEGEDPARYREEVMRRMKMKTETAKAAGITLLHENEKQIFGDQPERCLDIIETVNSLSLRGIFDPANFVQCGRLPYDECWPILKKHIVYFHIKDALLGSGEGVPAGQGDGGVAKILKEAKSAGFKGFLSVEPHLGALGKKENLTGAQLFEKAVKALRKILKDIGGKET